MDTIFEDITIEEMIGRYASFANSEWKGVKLDNSKLEESSLQEIKLKKVAFKDVSFLRSELMNTRFKDIDLRSVNINGVMITPNDIKEAIVNSQQALKLSTLLGIVINDD